LPSASRINDSTARSVLSLGSSSGMSCTALEETEPRALDLYTDVNTCAARGHQKQRLCLHHPIRYQEAAQRTCGGNLQLLRLAQCFYDLSPAIDVMDPVSCFGVHKLQVDEHDYDGQSDIDILGSLLSKDLPKHSQCSLLGRQSVGVQAARLVSRRGGNLSIIRTPWNEKRLSCIVHVDC